MDNNQGGPGEPLEPEEAEKSRTYAARNGETEPGTPVVNGEKETSKVEPGPEEIRTSEEVGDRDHRRPQEKKKAKGLGEQRPGRERAGLPHLVRLQGRLRGCVDHSPGLFSLEVSEHESDF